tara:strand:+ start:574 stop:2082 length:1509 start_codon:yes stop_codon:yes gene_type:complete
MDQNNGGIIGKINTPTTTVASGVWSLDSQFESQSGSTWPLAFPQVTLANACKFDAASSDSLTRTFGTPTNNKIWTYSFWMKHCDNQGVLLNTGADTSYMYFRGSSASPVPFGFSVEQYVGSFQYKLIPNEVFRDHSAWQHIVIAFDTTQSTASDRAKIYKNGSQITSFNTADYPSENLNTQVNSAVAHKIGGFASSGFYDGYLTEVIFVDGQQLTPTSFGAFNTVSNIWEPRPYAGTYGNNGFKLNFTDSSNLGDDTSGNGNDFTVNNLTSVDQSTDTCSNNFATLNPLDKGYTGAITLSQGNLVTESSSGAGDTGLRSTIGVTTGKWYLEAKIASSNTIVIGDIDARLQSNMNDGSPADDFYGIQRYSDTKTNLYNDGTFVSQNTAMWGGFTSSDIISIALDLDNNKIFFAKNGSFKDSSGNTGDPANGTNPTFTISDGTKTYTFYTELRGNDADGLLINFGNPPFTISSGNADANGFGNFEYAVPSGFLALCTKNLAENG